MGKKYLRWQEKLSLALKRDPNRLCGNEYTPLQNAIYKDDFLRVKSLLNAGADPNYCGKKGYNSHPLAIAIKKRNSHIVNALLQAKADPEHHFVNVSMLSQAIKSRRKVNAELLIKYKANVNIRDLWTEETPVFHVHKHDPHFINILYNAGADLDIQNAQGETALYKASDIKNYRLVEALLSCGANPNICPPKRKTLLERSMNRVLDKHDEEWKMIYRYVEKGADPNTLNKKGQSLYHIAVLFKDPFMMERYKRQSDNILTADAEGNTPLHTAIKLADYNIFKKVAPLYKTLPEDTNKCGEDVMKALVNMNFYRYPGKGTAIPVIKGMLSLGADVNTKDEGGMTLLHYAVQANDTAFANLLLNAGADTNICLPDGIPLLETAIKHENLDLVDALLDHGADPNAQNERGWTILDNLAKGGDRSSPIVQRIIAGGGRYNKQLAANEHVHGPSAVPAPSEDKTKADEPQDYKKVDPDSKNPVKLVPKKNPHQK